MATVRLSLDANEVYVRLKNASNGIDAYVFNEVSRVIQGLKDDPEQDWLTRMRNFGEAVPGMFG